LPLAELRRDLRPHVRWPLELDHHRQLPDLHRGVRLQQNGLRLRHGVRAVRLHRGPDADRAADREGTMSSTMTIRTRRRRLTRTGRIRVLYVAILLVATLAVLFPFLWMVSIALTPAELAFRDVKIWPDSPTLENFVIALTG